MFSGAFPILILTAASIGFVHTLIGPDHYIPFIMMQRAQGWSRARTLWITAICGVGHVLSSIVLGAIGVAFGIALQHLQLIESVRGDLAAWALITFGLIYAGWGVRRALQNRTHAHTHVHDGCIHSHEHGHRGEHLHPHTAPQNDRNMFTAWALFTVFVLGPCEPLIPLLMYPAAMASTGGLVLVTGTFAIVTIGTMVGMVLLVGMGVERLPLRTFERWTHALAGAVIAVSGIAIQALGV